MVGVVCGVLRHRPDGPGRGGSRGSRLRGPPVVLWAPMGFSSPRQRPEAWLERRGGGRPGRATILPASAPPHPPSLSLPPPPPLLSSVSPFLLLAFSDVVKCGPKDVLVARVLALSEKLIGGSGEKLNMRFLFREGGARDSSGPDWSQGQQPLTREGRVVDVLGKRPPGLGSPGR